MDASLCTTCGVEWSSHQKLLRKINILENQQGILNDELRRVGHINQLHELRIRTLQLEEQRHAALADSSKQAAAGLQTQLESQQATIEVDRREHAIAVQSLEHESARREDTECSLQHERAIVQKMIAILDKVGLPNGNGPRQDLLDSIGLGTLFYELENTKSEANRLRNELQRMAGELQHKQLVMENLSRNFQVESQSMSETSFSDSDEEISTEEGELRAASTLQGMGQRSG